MSHPKVSFLVSLGFASCRRTLVAASSFLVFPSCICFADQDPSTIVIPYSSSGNRTLGDGVNIAFPYTPLGRCVSYQAADLVWDTGGAISSDGDISVVSDTEDEKRTTDLSLGFQTEAKIKYGIFNANSKFDAEGTNETFRSDNSTMITLAFRANADYGRRLIQNYKLDSSAPSPTTDLGSFLQRCGSHFIRGEQRASDLTILIHLTTTSQAGKDALTTHLEQTLGGGVSFKAISGKADSTFTAAYKSIVEFAKKTGSVTVDYRAHGGPGISAAGEAAKVVDPTDFTKLSDIAASVSSLFTQDNSGIIGYVLQSNTALGAPPVNFDIDRIEQIGALTRNLLVLGEAANRYDDLKSRNLSVYKTYFEIYADRVDVLRSQLTERIKICAAGGDCTLPPNDVLQGFLFLEDMFSKADVSLSCQYQLASDLLPTVSAPSNDPMILESVSINLEGITHNPDLIDFTSTHVVGLTADNNIEDLSSQFAGFAFSSATPDGSKRAFGTIFSENIDPKTAITYDNSTKKFIVNTAVLQERRDDILGSAFSIYAPGPNGVKVSYDVGFPPRSGCPLVK